MDSGQKRNRMVCSSCYHTFNLEEATVVNKKLFGIDVPEKRCPLCGGVFRAVEIPNDLDIYLFVNKDERYYSYRDKGKN